MFNNIHLGGQHRRDAVTGARGMSADTALHASQGLYQQYFYDSNYRQRTAGLTAEDMGGMFDELTRRGMMAQSGTLRERVVGGLAAMQTSGKDVTSLLRGAGVDTAGLATTTTGMRSGLRDVISSVTDEQVKKLSENSDVQFGMRSSDTGRIAQTLDKYKGALAAVKEIFGENGNPNAPMRELMNALESLTQGGLQQINSGRVEMTVRNMYNAAKLAGVDMGTVSAMMGAAGQQTDAMGLNPMFASQMTTSGLIFGATYMDQNLGSTPAWGLMNQKQMMGAHMAAYGRAANSDTANRIGAVMRLAENVGGFNGDAAALVNGIKSGSIDPGIINKGYGDFVEMIAAGSGLSTSEVERALESKQANQEFVYKNNLGGLISKYVQPEEFNNQILAPAFEEAAYDKITKIMGAGDHGDLAARMGKKMIASIRGMGTNLRRNAGGRNARMTADMSKYLSSADPNSEEGKLWAKLQGLTPQQREKELAILAETGMASAEQHWNDEGGEGNIENAFTMYSADARTGSLENEAEVKLQSALQSISAGSGAGTSPLMDAMRAIQEGGANPDQAKLTTVLMKALGGKAKKEVVTTLGTHLMALNREGQKLAELEARGEEAGRGGADAEARWSEQIDAQQKAVNDASAKIKAYMDENGLTQTLGEMTAEGQSQDMTFNNVTITAPNVEITMKGKNTGTGTSAKPDKRGGSPVAP
jgi:hypothetical protein